MELKHKLLSNSISISILSIAPEWNWNHQGQKIQIRFRQPINRTRMELKLTISLCLRILKYSINRTRMELKQGWMTAVRELFDAINRTRMELKRGKINGLKSDGMLSIAPEWNWNILRYHRYNCHNLLSIAPEWNWNNDYDLVRNDLKIAINRTRMELKLQNYLTDEKIFSAINRTRMELKPSISFFTLVLILSYQSHQNGIETCEFLKVQEADVFLSIAPEWNWNVIIFIHEMPLV